MILIIASYLQLLSDDKIYSKMYQDSIILISIVVIKIKYNK